MACGCPAVALAVGGVREVIENRGTGLVAAASDWEGVAHRIIALLENPRQLKEMSVAARARVEKYFNVETNTQHTAELLRNVPLKALTGRQLTSNGSLIKEKLSRTFLESSEETGS